MNNLFCLSWLALVSCQMYKLLAKNLFVGNLCCVHVWAAEWEKNVHIKSEISGICDSRISHLHSTKCCVGWVMANSYLFLSAWYLNLNIWFLFKEYKRRKIRSPVLGVSSLFTWRNERVYLSDTVLTVSVQSYVMRGDIRRSHAVKTWCNLNQQLELYELNSQRCCSLVLLWY